MQRRTFVMGGLGPLVLAACGGGGEDTRTKDDSAGAASIDEGPMSAEAQSHGRQAVTFLEPVNGTESAGSSVNNRGQVAGWTGAGADADVGTTLWTPGRAPVRFATLGGFGSGSSTRINEAGRIVGSSTVTASQAHATLWAGGKPIDLGTLNGVQASGASSINNAGQIVGWSYTAPGNPAPVHAVLWRRGAMIDLGTLGGESSAAADINNAGVIVGESAADRSTGRHATVWRHGTMTDIGVPGAQTSASALNDAGLIVGTSSSLDQPSSLNAVKWVGGTMIRLATLGGGRAIARDVNNAGLIVGWSSLADADDGHAILWNGDVAIDLNRYLDEASRAAGWYLADAMGISDSGWVTGEAFNSITGARRAYRLSLLRLPRF